jgi:hypothetical protein
MTSLDDALNTSAPMFDPVTITADWVELPPGVSVGGVDSLRDLGQQVGPSGYTVQQSFDDGLPDPVTMTMSFDASGSMSADLAGRPANVATTLPTFRSTTSGFGTATAIPVTMPGDLASSDYAIVAITVNGTEPVFEGTYGEEDPAKSWRLLTIVSDSTYNTYVFGRVHFLTTLAPTFQVAVSSPFTWAVVGIGSGLTGGPSIVPMRPGVVTTKVETVTGTAHTGPLGALPNRGYVLGIFSTAAASGPWTPVGTAVELVENTGGTAALQMVRTAWIDVPGSYQIASNTTGSTGVGMMVSIPLVLDDRPAMDAMAFFSPFNAASPVKDFEHDTAPVETIVNVVSPVGVIGTSVFKGQMADLTLGGRIAALEAVSKTRLDLDKASILPTVFGRRESCTTDWLASWLLAQGGQYIGVAPSPQTRWWAPLHGSVHAHMDGPNGYAGSISYYADRTPKGPWSNAPPAVVDGPFLKAMFGQETDPRTDYNFWVADRKQWATEVPGMVGEFNDVCSQQNSIGRFTFWIRGDATELLPDSWSGTGLSDMLFSATISATDGHGHSNFLSFRIDSSRKPQIYLESGYVLTGGDMPTDGLWHFFGFTWDYANGLSKVRRDNVTWNPTGYTSTGFSLPASEAAALADGGQLGISINSRLPVAEMQLESGPNLYTEAFTRFYPTPTAPSRNVTYRPTNQWIEAIAETTPQQGWSALHDLAKSTLSYLRVNEADNVEMLPLDYFGETAQMTVETLNVLDTGVNAGELGVISDASKTRNFVTVEFQETRVDTNRSPILSITSMIEIPRGVTFMTFALDEPVAEVHGAIDPYGTTSWKVNPLTQAQINAPTTIPNDNVMTVNYTPSNALAYTGSGCTAFIVGWTNSTVRIRFTNTTTNKFYLTNNGQDVPFLRILGYTIKSNDAYESVRDLSSVAKRRERALTSQIRWVQRREEASLIAGNMVTALSRPRPQLNVTVMGDPRRVPGKLVSIADSEGTAASGTWRILAVQHRGNGAMYVQDLSLAYVGPIGVWDESSWDEAVWGV